MAPKNYSTLSDSGLSSALQLKQKLLAKQKLQRPSNSKTMASVREKLHQQEQRRREKRKASSVGLDKKSEKEKPKIKRRKQEKKELEEEYDEEDGEEKESEEDGDDSDANEDEVSVMDMMRRQFEMQFGKVAGVTDPVKKDNKQKKEKKEKKNEKSKKTKKASKQSHKKKTEEKEDEWDIEIPQHGHAFESMFHEFDSESEQEEQQQQPSSDDEAPVVVKYSEAGRSLPRLETSKREKKLFMSSKAPASVAQRLIEEKAAAEAAAAAPEEEEEDKILTQEDLKNDLELQRLLRESHILADAASQGKLSGYDISSAYDVEGRNGKMSAITGGNSPGVGGLFGQARVQTMEMRMDLLGMKKKRERAVNMKVLQSRAAELKKERRRQIDEAREAGIILPTSVLNGPESKKKNKSADRGLKIQLVGKHTKHGLSISKKEIESVSGPSRD